VVTPARAARRGRFPPPATALIMERQFEMHPKHPYHKKYYAGESFINSQNENSKMVF
jgi:hypothetical protein